jgi:hypothetical protein
VSGLRLVAIAVTIAAAVLWALLLTLQVSVVYRLSGQSRFDFDDFMTVIIPVAGLLGTVAAGLLLLGRSPRFTLVLAIGSAALAAFFLLVASASRAG